MLLAAVILSVECKILEICKQALDLYSLSSGVLKQRLYS